MQFDWYQATIDSTPASIIDAAMGSLAGAHDVEHLDHGGKGYKATALIRDRGQDTLATLLYRSASAMPNLKGTSHNAVPVSDMIRKHWPKHSVSRLDVAEDMAADGLFENIEDRMRRIARGHAIESGKVIIPDASEKGRTYYVGSPTSATMVRLYEKGLHEISRGNADADPHHVRLEIQARPQKAAKQRFATIAPAAVWGSSKWTQHLAQEVMALDVPRLNLRPREETDLEHTTAAVVHQYLNHAKKHGAVIGEIEHGLVSPSARDAITLWGERLIADMIRADEQRVGASALTDLFPAAS